MPDNTEQNTDSEQLFAMPDGSTMTQEQAAAMFTEHGNIKAQQAASTQRDQELAVDRTDLETREQALTDAQAEYDAAQAAQSDPNAMWEDPNAQDAQMAARIEKLEKAEADRIQAGEWKKTQTAMLKAADVAIHANPAFKDMEDISGIQSRVYNSMYATGATADQATASMAEFVGGFAPAKEPETKIEPKPAPVVVGGASGGQGAGVIEKKEVDFYADRDATEARMSAGLDAARRDAG